MQRACTKSALVYIVGHSHILTTIFTRGTRCVGYLYTSSEWLECESALVYSVVNLRMCMV